MTLDMSAGQDERGLLIVDDDERIRTLLRRFLVRNGYYVTTARDAGQARRLLAGLAAPSTGTVRVGETQQPVQPEAPRASPTLKRPGCRHAEQLFRIQQPCRV